MPRIAWENDILGFVPKTDWLDVGTIVARPNDPVDQLIDDTKTIPLTSLSTTQRRTTLSLSGSPWRLSSRFR